MTTTTLSPRSLYIAWGPLLIIGLVHVAALLAFVPNFFSWSGVLVCLVLHWVTGGVGICLTYHRLLTHRSFATRPKWLEYVMTAFGCCSLEGGPIGWVSDHRRHHAHSDEEDDVHSPDRGFGWAHMFWWMTPDVTSRHTPEYFRKWAPDLLKDPALRFLNTWHLIFPIALGVGLYALGGMPWLVWGCFVRTILVLHTTWLVNSATHMWGYRSHQTRDRSTNLWWVALLTYGEGWHNNHHAFQTSARHGLAWWEIDPTYIAIRAMQMLGLAHSIKLPKRTRGVQTPIETDDIIPGIPVEQTLAAAKQPVSTVV
jgi:stearoyl-CoA desaturase (delta-9 desaturase)